MKQRNRKTVKQFSDGIANPLMRVGTGTNNIFDQGSTYLPKFTTLNRQQLEWQYQTSWMSALAVDIVAEDMTREGIDLRTDDPDTADKINEVIDDYGVMDSLCETIKWARLYGGAIAVIMIDGQDSSTPLTRVPKDSFRGLCVFDRWQLDSVVSDLDQTLGENFGKPEFYRIISANSDVQYQKPIHHSRVIRLDGRKLPFYLRQSYQGWGASIIEPAMSQIQGFDLATQSVTQLISKSYLRYYKVEGLRDILTNELASKGFMNQMEYVRKFQTFEGLTLGDKNDEFQTFSYSFTGLPDVLVQLGQQVSGAFGIPLVRLFGQSPAGLNSTGESDLRNYYDNVKKQQKTMLRSGVKRLLNAIYESVTGNVPPSDFRFEFRSLWQMSQVERSQVAMQTAQTIADSYDRGLLDLPNALKELKTLSDVVGVFASITDEDIETAMELESEQMPPMPEEFDGNFQEEDPNGISRADQDQTH